MLRRRRGDPDRQPSAAGTEAAGRVLGVLDACARSFTFPALDNGYLYLAATRLSAFGDGADWALVIEVFGYSPRAGTPDLHVHTFASRLHDRNPPEHYSSRAAYDRYLQTHPNDESRFFAPIDDGAWIDGDHVQGLATHLTLRGVEVELPDFAAYAVEGIRLADPLRVHLAELSRCLAVEHRSEVLGTDDERRTSVLPHLPELLVLDEWHHPDLSGGELPSDTETFRRLAELLAAPATGTYRATEPPNTHWSSWPHGGSL